MTLKELLAEAIRGPLPNTVREGSVQVAIRYKQWATKAAAATRKAKVKDDDLRSLLSEYAAFNK